MDCVELAKSFGNDNFKATTASLEVLDTVEKCWRVASCWPTRARKRQRLRLLSKSGARVATTASLEVLHTVEKCWRVASCWPTRARKRRRLRLSQSGARVRRDAFLEDNGEEWDACRRAARGCSEM